MISIQLPDGSRREFAAPAEAVEPATAEMPAKSAAAHNPKTTSVSDFSANMSVRGSSVSTPSDHAAQLCGLGIGPVEGVIGMGRADAAETVGTGRRNAGHTEFARGHQQRQGIGGEAAGVEAAEVEDVDLGEAQVLDELPRHLPRDAAVAHDDAGKDRNHREDARRETGHESPDKGE